MVIAIFNRRGIYYIYTDAQLMKKGLNSIPRADIYRSSIHAGFEKEERYREHGVPGTIGK